MQPNPIVALLSAFSLTALALLLFWPGRGLIPRWRRGARLSERVLSEDALKFICKREAMGYPPTVQSIAGNLNISVNQAADVLVQLEEKKLVRQEEQTFLLTENGREYALNIVRAHRLWERYLADRTGYAEEEWHGQAERREHSLTPQEVEALARKLGSPTHDPHGDPIPTATRDLVFHGGKPLTGAAPEVPLRIVHVEDEPETVYAQLVAEGLRPGMTVFVIDSDRERVRFLADGEQHILAPIVAANIAVVPLPREEEPSPEDSERLTTLRPGETGEVVQIARSCRGPARRRLMDLGILPGTVIGVEMESPAGDLAAYRVRDALIALRDEQAKSIRVRKVNGGVKG
jgi:DtxR family Mn-dependent transcriptional regulator